MPRLAITLTAEKNKPILLQSIEAEVKRIEAWNLLHQTDEVGSWLSVESTRSLAEHLARNRLQVEMAQDSGLQRRPAMPDPRMLELALKTTECPCKDGDTDNRNHPARCVCKGTDKVYLLDSRNEFGLRVKCAEHHFKIRVIGISRLSRVPVSCEQAECRGWTPATDPWAYVDAAKSFWLIQKYRGYLHLQRLGNALWDWAISTKLNPGQVAFEVVYEELKEKL